MFSLKMYIVLVLPFVETTKIDTKAVVIIIGIGGGKKKQITRSLSRQAGNNECTSTPFQIFRVECLIFGYFCFLHTNHTIINNTKNHSRFAGLGKAGFGCADAAEDAVVKTSTLPTSAATSPLQHRRACDKLVGKDTQPWPRWLVR
jgi:hypothetical protein